MCLCIVLLPKSDDVWVMAQFQYTTLKLYHLFLVEGKLELLYHLDGDFLVGFLFDSLVNHGKVACSHSLHYLKFIVHTIEFELRQKS